MTERRRMEEIMKNLSVRFASIYGTEFFNRVSAHICEVLGADYTFVGKLISGARRVRVIGGMGRGEPLEPFEYALEGTPCVEVIGKQACVYESDAQALFPEDRLLAEMDIEGYAGIPLYSRSGDPLGIFVTLSTGPITDKQLAVAMMTGYSERVSAEIERTDAEAALSLSEERFSKAFHYISDALAITSLEDMKLVEVNEGFTRLTGFERSEAIGKSTEELGLWADPEDRRTFLETLDARGVVEDMEATFKTRTGEERNILFSSRTIDLAGRPHIITVARDITKRKRSEEYLRESEGKYRSLFENANDAIFLIDAQTTKILDCNEKAAEMEGYSIEELKVMNVKDLHPEDEWPLLSGAFKKISEQGSLTGLSGFHHLRKDGRLVPIEVSARMIELGGRPINFAIIRDLTEREKAREALERSQEFLNATGQMAKVGGWEVDLQTLKVRWTDETCRIAEVPLGYNPSLEEAINFFHPEDRPGLEQVIQRALEHGEPYDIEIRFITAAGRQLWAHAIGKPQVIDGRTVKLAGTFQDITERKKADDALHRKDRDIRRAYANVFSAVTDEKLLILTPEEISAAEGEPQGEPYRVSSFEQLAASRDFLRSVLGTRKLTKDYLNRLILASGEAVTNGVKHAGSCEVQVYSLEGSVQIRVSDSGPGINFSDLPKAALLPGFSTKKSLGMGFALIFDICDRILLSTGPEGTTLLLESGGEKEKDELDDILERGLFKEA